MRATAIKRLQALYDLAMKRKDYNLSVIIDRALREVEVLEEKS